MPLGQFRENQDGLKLNGTHQILVYDDDDILGGSVHTIKKNSALVVASKVVKRLD
jgi:hypothetical protein